MSRASSPESKTCSLYSDPWQFYSAMLADIESAVHSVCIETYKFGNDTIGQRFRDVLCRKAAEGVKVRILIDFWGAQVSHSFFRDLARHGGEVRFFMKIKFFWDFFTKNHRRNHRKLLLVDNRISYIGSSNISGHSLNWCESVLRLENEDLNKHFLRIFTKDFRDYNKYVFNKPGMTRLIRSGDYEIIRDVPSITQQNTKRRFESLIRNAREKVVILTPYFLPGFQLRKSMSDAVKRGVDVKVIIPKNSDVQLVDLARGRYLGMMHRNGIRFYMFLPTNLHAKVLFIDDEIFVIGSSNFDYRSFRYQHEISLLGRDENTIQQLKGQVSFCLGNSVPFDYDEWMKRPFMQRLMEQFMLPFRHLL